MSQSKNQTDTLDFSGAELSAQGLNIHAVFNIAQLPEEIIEQLIKSCSEIKQYNQLILIGHAGTLLWKMVSQWLSDSKDPVDEFSYFQTEKYFKQRFSPEDFKIIFPGTSHVGLQALGRIAGWHHSSPFRVGINWQWGSWFAYRSVVLVKSHYSPTEVDMKDSPCLTCSEKACVSACPAKALVQSDLSLKTCIDYRKKSDSDCKDRCKARMACPVARKHQYSLPQTQYHYSLSMKVIEKL